MKERNTTATILGLFGILQISEHDTILQRLREEVDINLADSGGRTLLMEAVIRRDQELVSILLANGADPNIRDNRDWTALHFASQDYDLTSVRKLVEHGSNINAQDDFGNTPLWRATFNSRGRGDVIRFLLAHGADQNL